MRETALFEVGILGILIPVLIYFCKKDNQPIITEPPSPSSGPLSHHTFEFTDHHKNKVFPEETLVGFYGLSNILSNERIIREIQPIHSE